MYKLDKYNSHDQCPFGLYSVNNLIRASFIILNNLIQSGNEIKENPIMEIIFNLRKYLNFLFH